jgi:hypothetical protein
MPSIYRIFIDIIIWVLFIKGLVLIPVTIYLSKAYLSGQAASMEPLSTCVAGTIALAMASAAIYVRHKIQ